MDEWSFGSLGDPTLFHDAIDICDESAEELFNSLELMYLIRLTERKLADGKRIGDIGGPIHLGVGQEAVAVGVSATLRKTDRVFGGHRSHSHILSLGVDLRAFFAEILGKDTGVSRGMGGSMHLWDQPNGFYGSVPIVAGTVSLAVGAGLAAKLQNTDDISVAYLGDGAMEEGVVHESLNLSKILMTPTLFVVENNLFASHMHISLRQPKELTARFAVANDVPYKVVDGNDLMDVRTAAAELIAAARASGGPGFLEAITYRWYGHVDWCEDTDVGLNRSIDVVNLWKKRDPISRLALALINAGYCTEDDIISLEYRVGQHVAQAWQQAMNDPYPELSSLMDRVYLNKEDAL